MTAVFELNISNDFSAGVVSKVLMSELNDNLIAQLSDLPYQYDDTCVVSYATDLSPSDETAFWAIIAAHDGLPYESSFEIFEQDTGSVTFNDTSWHDAFPGSTKISPEEDGIYKIDFIAETAAGSAGTVVQIGIAYGLTGPFIQGSSQRNPAAIGNSPDNAMTFAGRVVLTRGTEIYGLFRKLSGGGSIYLANRRMLLTKVGDL